MQQAYEVNEMKKGMEKVIAERTDVTEKRSQGNMKSEKLTETIE